MKRESYHTVSPPSNQARIAQPLCFNGFPMKKNPPITLGITGGTGSGKTTIADEIVRVLGTEKSVLIHQDSYYLDHARLPADALARLNFDHPRAFDWGLLKRHLRALRAGRSIERPIYNFHTHRRMDETIAIAPRPVVIVEGILVFDDPALRGMLDIKVYVDADADVRFIRRLERDMRERGRSLESIVEQYLTTVRPMHLQFIEPTKRYADIIVPEGGHNRVAVETIIARVRAML